MNDTSTDGLATRSTHEEFRVWREIGDRKRRWTTVRTRERADEVITELRGDGTLGVHRVPMGIEHVVVTEISDGIEWQA